MLVTAVVVIVKVALVLPAATVTLVGVVAADESSLRETTTPPVRGSTAQGHRALERRTAGDTGGTEGKAAQAHCRRLTVRVAVLVTPP